MDTFTQELNQLMEIWGISQASLAEKIGMSRSAFSNKCNPGYRDNLNIFQINKLKDLLRNLKTDIEHVISIYPEENEVLEQEDGHQTEYRTEK